MEQNCVYYDGDQICITIPRRLYETVNSFPYVDICDEQLNKLLLDTILFRAESAVFQVQRAMKPELSCEQFLALLSQSGDMRKALKESVLRAIDNFDYSRLDFAPNEESLPRHNEVCRIYDAIEGESIVHYIALLVEREQYRRLCAAKGEYGWIEYTRELRKNDELAGQAKSALIEAAETLDFCALFE